MGVAGWHFKQLDNAYSFNCLSSRGGEILDKREILRSNLNINGAKAFEYEGKLIFYPPPLILTFIHKYRGGKRTSAPTLFTGLSLQSHTFWVTLYILCIVLIQRKMQKYYLYTYVEHFTVFYKTFSEHSLAWQNLSQLSLRFTWK